METPTTKTEAVETLLKLKEKLKHIGSPGDLRGVMEQIRVARMKATQEQQLEAGIDPNDAMLLDLRNMAIKNALLNVAKLRGKDAAMDENDRYTQSFGVKFKISQKRDDDGTVFTVDLID